jgi:hypothetical protein
MRQRLPSADGDASLARCEFGVPAVEPVDEPTGLIQFTTKSVGDRIPAAGAAGPSSPVPLVGGFELVRDPPYVPVQLVQQCSRLCAPRVLDHLRILSWFLNVRALGREEGREVNKGRFPRRDWFGVGARGADPMMR